MLLDTTPDQEMLDEGVAREVVNRVQKLRKSAGLKVDDQVVMQFTVSPKDHYLANVITKFSDYIQTSSKTPLQLKTSQSSKVLKSENYDLKGAKLELSVVPGDNFSPSSSTSSSKSSSQSSSGPGANPASSWVNLVLLGSPPASYVGSPLAGSPDLPQQRWQ